MTFQRAFAFKSGGPYSRRPKAGTRNGNAARGASPDTIQDGRFLQMSARRCLAVVVILLNLNAAAGCVADLPTSALAPAAPSGSASAGSSPSATGADITMAIMIAGGTVSPSGVDVPVRVGQRVQVNAVSDVAESIHIHGYDITLTLPTRSSRSGHLHRRSGRTLRVAYR
ncbi:MAG TPA: hypothetical protein VK390_08675 [Propionibacteriaceae bacterium]|nr:hypothetical protein [Propionibacteriaceae bacterium]